MYECDKRMLEIIEVRINKGVVSNRTDFCRRIEMTPETVNKITKGINHFTTLQIQKTCDLFGVNANYIFGKEQEKFIKKTSK